VTVKYRGGGGWRHGTSQCEDIRQCSQIDNQAPSLSLRADECTGNTRSAALTNRAHNT